MFSLCVSLPLKSFSCRQYIEGSCSFIQSATLCLLIGAFSPLTFKVIIDRYVLIIFYKFIYLFLFIFCVGSSLLCAGFLQLQRAGATLCCGVQASHCGGFSHCRAWALGMRAQQLWLTVSRMQAQQLWCMGLVAPWHVRSSRTRAQTCVPCIGRQILNHCTTREVPVGMYLLSFYYLFSNCFCSSSQFVSSFCFNHCGLMIFFCSMLVSLSFQFLCIYYRVLKNKFYLFIYLFLAELGLCCCMWAFSSCGEWGLLFVAEHGLQAHGLQQLWHTGSAVVAHRLSCSMACGIFPDKSWNPCPLHWQADSQPPGKPYIIGF